MIIFLSSGHEAFWLHVTILCLKNIPSCDGDQAELALCFISVKILSARVETQSKLQDLGIVARKF